EREMLSGNAVARETVLVRPAVLALMPGFSASAVSPTAPTCPAGPSRRGVRAHRAGRAPSEALGGLHLETAERIVTVGRGLQKKEDLALIEALAKALGASLDAPVPLAAEAGWLSDDHWIGLTGHRVKPRLYVAIGVSGAVQHLVGCGTPGPWWRSTRTQTPRSSARPTTA
ncbi:electron transfer flavoprotein alpha subunit, partial [mine drainage metagenome]